MIRRHNGGKSAMLAINGNGLGNIGASFGKVREG
jgi:hypothetical protein